VRNITISLDDVTYRRVRVLAAERDLSISGLVKRLLMDLDSGAADAAQELKVREKALRERIAVFSAGERLSREAAHERKERRS
jgi:hypothetical protein